MYCIDTIKLEGQNRKDPEMKEKPCEVCPICSGPVHFWRIKNTNIFGAFSIDRCGSCGYAFVNPRPSLQFLKDFYLESGHKSEGGGHKCLSLVEVVEQERIYPNSTVDAERIIRTAISLNPDCNTFLDVGSGYGFFLREALLNKLDVTAIEVAASEIEICSQLTKVKPLTVSFEDFQHEKNYFSIILMSQILEHALDVNLWIEKARKLLKRNGVLAIALPNFGSIFRLVMQENEPYICPPAHLNFFTAESLSNLLRKHGFDICKVQYVSRIPYQTIERKLSNLGLGNSFAKTVHNLTTIALRAIDLSRLGMMLNIYAKKNQA